MKQNNLSSATDSRSSTQRKMRSVSINSQFQSKILKLKKSLSCWKSIQTTTSNFNGKMNNLDNRTRFRLAIKISSRKFNTIKRLRRKIISYVSITTILKRSFAKSLNWLEMHPKTQIGQPTLSRNLIELNVTALLYRKILISYCRRLLKCQE